MRSMRSRILIMCSSIMLVLAFQNCGNSMNSAGSGQATLNSGTPADSQKIIGTTASFKKITYDPAPTFTIGNGGNMQRDSVHVELSTDTGLLGVEVLGTSYACTLDPQRLSEAREILSSSKICETDALVSGTVSCMAVGLPDVVLSNDNSSVQLKPVICHSGTFLCDGNDRRLRSLISDLKENLPSNCVIH